MLPATREYVVPNELDVTIFEATVPPDHYLRRVLAAIDFERCREELACRYSPTQGRPAIEPVLLLKLEFLQYHYNLSDRDVIDQARYNMAFRYFLGLSLKSPLPHHTLLTVFRERLGSDRHQKVFESIIAQAREYGLVKDRVRLKDATHILANIAIPSTVRLVAETRRRLLNAVRPYAPERVVEEETRAEVIHTTTADLSGQERLLQRVNHLRSIVSWIDEQVAAGPPAEAPQSDWQTLLETVHLAHKVLADRQEPKAKDRLVNVHDPDARWGMHQGHYAGYLLDVSEDIDSGLVTAVNVLPANGDETQDASTLIQQEEQAHGNDVQALSIDAIGFRGDRLREWTDPQGLNLEVIVPPRQEKAATGLFDESQFTPSATGETMICPAGHTSQRRRRNRHQTGWVFHWARGTCAACPLLSQCIAKLQRSKGRQLSTNDYAAEYAAARANAKTARHQEIRRQHWRVERKLGEMVRWHRARRARYRGRWRVLIQALMTALVVNVKCVVRLLTAHGVRAELVASS